MKESNGKFSWVIGKYMLLGNMTSTLPITFKAKTFRLNRSHQYADQLWLKNISTIASPSTTGETNSVNAAYLPDGDTALPTVFGMLSWTAPSSTIDAQCNIKVFDSTSHMVTAASFTPTKASFSGIVSTSQGLEIDNTWKISIDTSSLGLVFAKYNASTGLYEVKHIISSA